MKSLERLGLRLKEPVGLEELLSENFNPKLYGLTKVQEEKVSALRDVLETYISIRENREGKPVTGSQDAVAIAGNRLRTIDHEELWVAYLNRANVLLSFERLFTGSLDAVHISHREIIARALSRGASSVIVYHNHPSGNPTPGVGDINQTRELTKACKMMGIGMLDHIIISAGSWYSFADELTFKFKSK